MSRSRTLYRRYILSLIGSILLLFVLVSGINLVVDPFGLYWWVELDEARFPKTEVYSRARMVKAHALARVKPTWVVAGTSRTEWGIPMEHPAWREAVGPRYNLSLPGGNMYEIYRYIEYADRVRPLQTVVLGLDFFSFNALQGNQEGFSGERLDGPVFLLREKLATTVSLDTLAASYATLTGQAARRPLMLDATGSATDQSIAAAVSADPTPHDHLWSNVWRYFTRYYPRPLSRFSLVPGAYDQSQLASFQKILEYCNRRDIRLYLFIPPIHALKAQMIKEVGLWPLFEQWKRLVVRAYDAERQKGLEGSPLWDFADYNRFSLEPVPNAANKALEMQYFWNESHHRKNLGGMVLETVFHCDEETDGCLDGFGQILDPTTIEQVLKEIRLRQAVYEKQYSQDVAELRRFRRFIDNRSAR